MAVLKASRGCMSTTSTVCICMMVQIHSLMLGFPTGSQSTGLIVSTLRNLYQYDTTHISSQKTIMCRSLSWPGLLHQLSLFPALKPPIGWPVHSWWEVCSLQYAVFWLWLRRMEFSIYSSEKIWRIRMAKGWHWEKVQRSDLYFIEWMW